MNLVTDQEFAALSRGGLGCKKVGHSLLAGVDLAEFRLVGAHRDHIVQVVDWGNSDKKALQLRFPGFAAETIVSEEAPATVQVERAVVIQSEQLELGV